MPGRGSVAPEKLARIQELKSQVLSQPMTALVGVRGVPAAALQAMRRELRNRGHPILVAPNNAIRHALEEAVKDRPSLQPLLERVEDQTAILSAEGNPFALYQELFRTRSPTPARGGETAPHDIRVPAGTTSFKPGPIVGELQHAGFPAAIEKGKVVLKKDTIIVKAVLPSRERSRACSLVWISFPWRSVSRSAQSLTAPRSTDRTFSRSTWMNSAPSSVARIMWPSDSPSRSGILPPSPFRCSSHVRTDGRLPSLWPLAT